MKTVKIQLDSIKNHGWMELAHELLFDKFKKEHPELDDEEELSDVFYNKIVSKKFEYGEYASIIIEVDENFNIVGGKIL